MPSENKTPNYALNQWQGNEYPKRVDFVADNAAIDAALKENADKSATHKTDTTAHITAAEREKWNGGIVTPAERTAWSGKATATTYNATLTTAGWSASAPYTQTVTVSGLLATDNPIADVVLSGSAATAQAQLEAWGCVGRMVTAANSFTAYCYDSKPTTAIPIQLKVVR